MIKRISEGSVSNINYSNNVAEADPGAGMKSAPGLSGGISASAARRLGWVASATVLTIYVLILVGGIVRATGSGMGCPDWPTCFGQWIPPTSESQLPAGYQEIYADRGYAETTFNVRKTWTEYLNRLLGVFTGFLIFLTLLAALPYRKHDNKVFLMAFSGFVLVGFQGWLGSRVVASNLHTGMITLHMLVAQIIVAILIYTLVRSQFGSSVTGAKSVKQQRTGLELPQGLRWLLIVAMIASLAQILLGSQVREAIDLIARQSNFENRHLWIENLPLIFSVHRITAYPTVAISILFTVMIFREAGLAKRYRTYSAILALLVVGTLVLGLSLDQMHVPIYAQPLHLWFASMIFGAQFYMFVLDRRGRPIT